MEFMGNIHKSLEIGNLAEFSFIDYVRDCGFTVEKSIGREAGYDVRIISPSILSGDIFCEIKFDRMSSKTGNLAIEYFNPKSSKASGLTVTTSDFWVFALNEPLELWITQVNELRAYIESHDPFKFIDVAGDKNASLLLYKRDELLGAIFTRIDNMEVSNFKDFIDLYISERNRILCSPN